MFFGNLPPNQKYKIILLGMGIMFALIGSITHSYVIMVAAFVALSIYFTIPRF